jgi:hypothetical protein
MLIAAGDCELHHAAAENLIPVSWPAKGFSGTLTRSSRALFTLQGMPSGAGRKIENAQRDGHPRCPLAFPLDLPHYQFAHCSSGINLRAPQTAR